MKQKTKQLIMTLVALLALTTQAWADDPKVYNSGEVSLAQLEQGDILMPSVKVQGANGIYHFILFNKRYSIGGTIYQNGSRINSFPFSIGENGLISAQLGGGSNPTSNCMPITEDGKTGNAWVVVSKTSSYDGTTINIGGTIYPEPTPFAITWSAATPNTATLTNGMPAGNVTVSVEYFPQAEFAMSTGETPEALAPTAIPDVPATTDGPIVTPGTVKNIGTSEVKQGTLMYYVSTTEMTDDDLLALTPDKWSPDVPTATDLAQGAAYVYYYIKGAEPATIAERTDANTCSDGDILAANVVNVTLAAAPLWNAEFDLTNAPEEDKAPGVWSTDIPEGGVVKGTPVKVTYTGSKKVIGVKAEKKAKAPASTPLDNTTTAWTAGTFAVPAGGLTYSDAITVSGDVTLTLTDGETLTLNKGISLAEGATLTIQGNGTMNVNGTDGNTSSTVGGNHGTLILTSGTLTATGGNGASVEEFTDDSHVGNGGDAINGSVIVSGGTLTARGGNGGSVGDYCENCSGGNGGDAISGTLTINGGSTSVNDGSNGSIGDYCGNCTAGAGGKAVAGTVTDNR